MSRSFVVSKQVRCNIMRLSVSVTQLHRFGETGYWLERTNQGRPIILCTARRLERCRNGVSKTHTPDYKLMKLAGTGKIHSPAKVGGAYTGVNACTTSPPPFIILPGL